MAANRNPNYLVRIMTTQTDKPVIVEAPMPGEFMFDSESSYDAPFAQGLFGNGTIASAARLMGISLTSQALTAQLWQGSNSTQLSVELEFQAESNPLTEVRDPILALLKLATPSKDPSTGMIRSPGPQLDIELAGKIVTDIKDQAVDTGKSIFDVYFNDPSKVTSDGATTQTPQPKSSLGQAQGWKDKIKNIISIQIGTYAFFDSVVITNVQKTYTSEIDLATGWPQHARVTVQFKPLFLLLQDDLDNIFKSRVS